MGGAGPLDAVDGADIGMVQRGQHLGLPLKAPHPLPVGGELFGQDLERDLAAELGVCGAVDLAHPAGAKFAGDAVMGNGGVDHLRALSNGTLN